ncbi:MAG: O-antigen ligase family protein [Bacilli bacterium]|nr:O-antigen ligase family protein [Bacilli bacterium]
MGKLRFTLTSVVFWIVLVLSCILSESFIVFNSDPLKSFSSDSAFFLTVSIIILLVFYYFLEHKKNGLKFDKILLPSFCIIGLLLILNVFRQGERSFISYSGMWDFIITFSFKDRFMAALQIVIWLGVVYGLIFSYNRLRLNKESFRWIAKIYLLGIICVSFFDHFLEAETIGGIFNGTYEGEGLEFVTGNPNVWSLLIFSAILCALLLCYKRFNWYYLAAMIYLFIFNILTTCSSTFYISFIAITAFIIYEIVSTYRHDKYHRRRLTIIYLSCLLGAVGLFAFLVLLQVPVFSNIWSFIIRELFQKDFMTLTGRTDMWQRIIILMSGNPLDIIFGLGHQTATFVFREYMGTSVKSAHNAFFEIFLRYGLVGLLIYVGLIGVIIYCFILQIKKKNYRFSFFYGICFISIFMHSLLESTTLFTPNIGGLFFGAVFVLPVMNILQEKKIAEFKADILTINVTKETIKSTTAISHVVQIAYSVTLTIILKNIFNIGPYRFILILIFLIMINTIVISRLRKNKNYKPLQILSNNILLRYQNAVKKERNDE